MHKLYCYVDETGQDTRGNFFIVAIVITDNRQQELEKYLETIEAATGKRTAKWMKTSDAVRQAYIKALIEQELPGTLFVKNYSYAGLKGSFDGLEVLASAQALTTYRAEKGIEENNYKVTVAVDGLSKTMAKRMGSEFRKLGIKTRKVVGIKDEASAIIRLADAIAGLVREAHEGRPVYKILKAKLEEDGQLHEL